MCGLVRVNKAYFLVGAGLDSRTDSIELLSTGEGGSSIDVGVVLVGFAGVQVNSTTSGLVVNKYAGTCEGV